MGPETTARLGLELIQPGQASKHITHNHAIARLDQLVHASAVSDTTLAPPSGAEPGVSYIVPDDADTEQTGFGHPAGTLVTWSGARWDGLAPRAGLLVFVEDRQQLVLHTGSLWQDVGANADAPSTLGINATADTTNRFAVASPATLFTHEGASHRIALNKASASDTASIVFQTDYSGRAEFGTIGGDTFALKVSADGTTFREALTIAPGGDVSAPQGIGADALAPRTAAAGGATEVTGPPNTVSVITGIATTTLDPAQAYLYPVFIDRPTRILGLHVIVKTGSSTPGTLIRAGLFALGDGAASGSDWTVGQRLVDLGTHPADSPGHKAFRAAQPIVLQRGWYWQAVVTDGDGVRIHSHSCLTPGAVQMAPFGVAGTAVLRCTGPVGGIALAGQADAVVNGLPQTWPSDMNSLSTSRAYPLLAALPIWEDWSA